MNINVYGTWFDDIKKCLTEEELKHFTDKYRWVEKTEQTKIDIENLSEPSLVKLRDCLRAIPNNRSATLSAGQVTQWIALQQDPDSTCVSKLENLPSAMKKYIAKAPHRYLFQQQEDGHFIAWLVTGIKYRTPDESPAYVSIDCCAHNGSKRGNMFSIYSGDLRGRTVSQVLSNKGFYIETDEAMVRYNIEIASYMDIAESNGQFLASGKAIVDKGWYSSGFRTIEQSGRPVKVVIDKDPETNKSFVGRAVPYWGGGEDKIWDVPIHPMLRVFDLNEHTHYHIHINNVTPYIYDAKVGEKLVLPLEIKDFIETLVAYSANAFQDIISGKEGGTIILLEGTPGTGKTLSAEVYSEVMKRPLYKVQSSQLGVNAKELEDELKIVLQRAERWGAILLIDEADVYIHTRGDDINQNAIVGVFLRILEYYKGVLFMTTNRGTEVDDAIVSRMTARFKYEAPNATDQKLLWKMLAAQNEITFSEDDLDNLVKRLPNMTGRDIKNMLKLAYVAAHRKQSPVTVDLLVFVHRFKQ